MDCCLIVYQCKKIKRVIKHVLKFSRNTQLLSLVYCLSDLYFWDRGIQQIYIRLVQPKMSRFLKETWDDSPLLLGRTLQKKSCNVSCWSVINFISFPVFNVIRKYQFTCKGHEQFAWLLTSFFQRPLSTKWNGILLCVHILPIVRGEPVWIRTIILPSFWTKG